MLALVIVLGVLAALLVAAGVTDLRARRRRGRYSGVDDRAAGNARRLNEADVNMRSNGSIRDTGGGFGGGF